MRTSRTAIVQTVARRRAARHWHESEERLLASMRAGGRDA